MKNFIEIAAKVASLGAGAAASVAVAVGTTATLPVVLVGAAVACAGGAILTRKL